MQRLAVVRCVMASYRLVCSWLAMAAGAVSNRVIGAAIKTKGSGSRSREFLVQWRGVYWEGDESFQGEFIGKLTTQFPTGRTWLAWGRDHQPRTEWNNLYWPCPPGVHERSFHEPPQLGL
jgi:hypothetical protein